MKKILAVLALLFAMGFSTTAQTAGDQTSKKVKTGDLSISVREGKLTLNTVTISSDWKLAPIVDVLGSSGRVRPGYNITHSYDDLGLVAFEKANSDKEATGIVSEFQIYLSEGEINTVSPDGYYTGELKIEKMTISKYVSLEDMRRRLKEYKESESYSANNYRFAKDGLYMYVKYDKTDSIIQKISIGPDKR